LVGAAVARVDLQRARVVLERRGKLAGVAVGVAEIVLDLGVARVAQRGRRQQADRDRPVLRLDRAPARHVVGVEARVGVVFSGLRKRRTACEQESEEKGNRKPAPVPFSLDGKLRKPHFAASWCFTWTISQRSLSAFLVSAASFAQ